MMKKLFLTISAMAFAVVAFAQSSKLESVSYSGPYPVKKPFMVDEVNVNSEPFSAKDLLKTTLSTESVFCPEAQTLNVADGKITVKGNDGEYALHLLGFTFENSTYGKVALKVEGLADKGEVLIDGSKHRGDSLSLDPGSHKVIVKVLTEPGKDAALSISLGAAKEGQLSILGKNDKRMIALSDITDGTRHSNASLSPSGKYLISTYYTVIPGGKTSYSTKVVELATGKVLTEGTRNLSWLNHSDKYYYTRTGMNGREMVVVDPENGKEEVLASGIPEGRCFLTPNDDRLILTISQKAPAELKKEIYEIVNPEDRQSNWRNRSSLAIYDFKTGLMQPLTFGYHSVWPGDITADGKKMLLTALKWQNERPTSVSDIYIMDLETLEVEKIVDNDGFVSHGIFSPDGKKVLFIGSPESFGGIGMNVKKGQTPSEIDTQLYLMDLATKKVTPLTKKFNPNVSSVQWNEADGKVYFNAENKDLVSMYRLNPSNGKIDQMNIPEEIVKNFTLARTTPLMVYCGQGAMNSDRIYSVDLTNDKVTLIEDLSAKILDGIQLGECIGWDFKSSRGDVINGRYYLPPHFDPSKKYPLIVNYYGGCSPTSRDFETRYPHHLYAARGYVVYVINPSGATGFGQEFSARHVNTSGEGVSDDIIEGTKKFVEEHPYVDASKIGCIGASYGGFMTQYLQTKTDIFAAAISHAGISSNTSYWGNGYWGYSYSQTSMANSYPWSRKDLYVDRSPLYNADKIHTPLLFLHGSEDTNVPIGESIQMFTALKLLNRPTAFVVVEGQDHHILDYDKRKMWQDTIFAWFQKWLQDDSSWWDALYPPKSLE